MIRFPSIRVFAIICFCWCFVQTWGLFNSFSKSEEVHRILADNYYPDDTFPRDEKCDLWDQLGMYMPWVHEDKATTRFVV